MTRERVSIYRCTCPECQQDPKGLIAQLHSEIKRLAATLDERNRRRFVGLWASNLGYGGVQHMARVTGMSRTTILRGQREIERNDEHSGERVRARGGGRKQTEKNSPTS
jgi:hypothetical protein